MDFSKIDNICMLRTQYHHSSKLQETLEDVNCISIGLDMGMQQVFLDKGDELFTHIYSTLMKRFTDEMERLKKEIEAI